MHIVRPERPEDVPGIRHVNESAFETPTEAALVDALRQQAQPTISLVALSGDVIVGHIMFSPVVVSSPPDMHVLGLAPMAVLPMWQRQGIGSSLVQAGLEACRRRGAVAVVVLGHPEYYPRFGFTPASQFGLTSEYDVPDEVFMAIELTPGALRATTGTVRYHPAFASV